MIIDFIKSNWGLLVLAVGLFLLLMTDIYLEHKMVRRILSTTVMILIYTVTCYIESFLGSMDHYSIMRSVLSAVNYSLINFIILNVILILFPNHSKRFYIPALINMFAAFISIPTHIVFGFSETNEFYRGPLGFLPYIVSAIYMIYLAVYLLYKRKSQRENLLILIYVLSTSAFCLLYPLIMKSPNSDWFYLTITINLVLYYIFLLQQYTKIDSLTKLLNRQTYYADLVNYGGSITAVITMDMNGLKTINDSEGHIAGDNALKALADCFLKASLGKQRVYRIGGDEYVMLCLNSGEEDVLALIERIRKEVANTRYTCSIGYAMKTEGGTVEQAYKQADQMLYKEKSQYYMYSGKDRRKR